MDFNEPSDETILRNMSYWDPEFLKLLFTDDYPDDYCQSSLENFPTDDDLLVKALQEVEEM